MSLRPSGGSSGMALGSTAAMGGRVPELCLVLFAAVWFSLAIAPLDRPAWLLENLLPVITVPTLVATARRFRFSDRAYVQITAFLLLHAIGSHYTYSQVPFGFWAADTFDLSRNHYDRLVHFAFGFLLLPPLGELTLGAVPRLGPVARAWLCVANVAACSVIYETLEWWVAVLVDPEAGTAFLGTQGDIWDAQKDSALACLGGVLALLIEPRDHRRSS